MLEFAGREADIVGLAPRVITAADGSLAAEPASITIAGAAEKIAWVREAAGERFDSIEFNAYPSGGPVEITPNARAIARDRADSVRKRTGVEMTTDELLESPHVYIGTVDALVEKILMLRERLGITSFMLGDVETALPIVERLAGS